ncbi:class I lanthipeptide [Aquimarina rubra]|uniref:Class I lanthipeptide n=1 Tax=Aquimarina rubra TaxID=1920033 RepID=A0ABW5LJ08_9FLAO
MKEDKLQKLNFKKLTVAKIDTSALNKIKGGTSIPPGEGQATLMNQQHQANPCNYIY